MAVWEKEKVFRDFSQFTLILLNTSTRHCRFCGSEKNLTQFIHISLRSLKSRFHSWLNNTSAAVARAANECEKDVKSWSETFDETWKRKKGKSDEEKFQSFAWVNWKRVEWIFYVTTIQDSLLRPPKIYLTIKTPCRMSDKLFKNSQNFSTYLKIRKENFSEEIWNKIHNLMALNWLVFWVTGWKIDENRQETKSRSYLMDS